MTRPYRDLETLAAEEIDDIDVATLQRMSALYERLDPVPPALIEAIKFELTLEALHAEIAELQSVDSLAGVRSEGADDSQTITFTSSNLTAMVTISPARLTGVRIDGWIAPGDGVQVDLRIDDAVRSTQADADGRFVFDEVPHGHVRFVLRRPGSDSNAVVTPSVEI